MTGVTICMAYYENPKMLWEHFAAWSRYSPQVRSRIRVILCDDGSTRAPLTAEFLSGPPLPVEAYRITGEKILWNQDAARNICVHNANGWCLLTDIDHVLPADQVGLLLSLRFDSPNVVYTTTRVEASTGRVVLGPAGEPKPHPNTWVIHRDKFWTVGGMDESYRGHYWGTDAEFRRRLEVGAVIKRTSLHLVRHKTCDVPDANTCAPRKEGRDMVAIDAIRRAWTGPRTMLSQYERIV